MLNDVIIEFRRHQHLAEDALDELDDAAFFHRPGPQANPVALIVKHVAGNLRSRWSEFLTSDGEKPDRNRDSEFQLLETDTRAQLMAAWRVGWGHLWTTLESLTDADLSRMVTIRREPHTVGQAMLRSLDHAAYHVGQITYLKRLLRPESKWLTVPPGQSRNLPGNYLKQPGENP